MRLKVRYNGCVKELEVSRTMNVEDFRHLVFDAFDVQPSLQRLIYSGKQLADGNDLMDYKVGGGHIISLVERVVLGEISSSSKKEANNEGKGAEIDPPEDYSSTSSSSLVDEVRRLCPELATEMEREVEEDGQNNPPPPPCTSCKDNDRRKCHECGCSVCGGKSSPETQLFCEQCEYVTHMGCLRPPLAAVPDGDWYCPDCYVDKDEIVKAGERVQLTRRTAKMPSRVARQEKRKTRDWDRGDGCASRRKVCTKVHIHHFGPVPGVEVGMSWESRMQLSEEGIHRPPVAGIAGKADIGAQSIVLSGGYEDDVDQGDEFFYTGAGGRDLSNNRRTGVPVADQTFTAVNFALARNCAAKPDGKNGATAKDWRKGTPIRVCRSYKARKKHQSKFAPEKGYRYDGIYKVVKYWLHRGANGFMVYRYLLRRDDPAPAPWEKGAKQFRMIAKVTTTDHNQEKGGGGGGVAEGTVQGPPAAKRPRKEEKEVKRPPLFQLDQASKDAIARDSKNAKLWEECLRFECETLLEFIDNVEKQFTCVCCQELMHHPVTTDCGHNVCGECLRRSIRAQCLTCPCCRKPIDEGLKTNEECAGALRKLFPGYDSGTGSNNKRSD